MNLSLEKPKALTEELKLPRIKPKGASRLTSVRDKYTNIRSVGPAALRSFKRTYKEALKRQVATGIYNPHDPVIIPTKEDERFRSWKTEFQPQANAAIIYIMDVSGSMTDEQKQIVRTEAFWIDTWLRSQYKGLETRYIVHDAAAKEVNEETFYRTRESGGTRISSAYKVCVDLIAREFQPADWNLYCFQFSDGDNWGEDNEASLRLLREQLLPVVNLFCYGQVESPYGSGEYLRSLRTGVSEHADRLVLSEIRDRDGIYDSIKLFLVKGK